MFAIALLAAAMPNGWTYHTEQFSLAPHAMKTVVAVCPAGALASSGGYQATDGAGGIRVLASFPNPNAASWAVAVTNVEQKALTVEVTSFARCDAVPPPSPPPPPPPPQ